uniref:Secreted protein n=1 Tax=Oryza glumipatula TaxID=40148 RepID=A0A0E0AQX3_9ORYZ
MQNTAKALIGRLRRDAALVADLVWFSAAAAAAGDYSAAFARARCGHGLRSGGGGGRGRERLEARPKRGSTNYSGCSNPHC